MTLLGILTWLNVQVTLNTTLHRAVAHDLRTGLLLYSLSRPTLMSWSIKPHSVVRTVHVLISLHSQVAHLAELAAMRVQMEQARTIAGGDILLPAAVAGVSTVETMANAEQLPYMQLKTWLMAQGCTKQEVNNAAIPIALL